MASLPAVFAAPCAGQQPPAAKPEIVVHARSLDALRAFVSSMTDANRSRQLTRWDRELCPTVTGIDPTQAEAMEERVREIAGSLHLNAHGRGCVTTMLVIVDDDAPGVAKAIVDHIPLSLQADERDRFDRFVASRRPVRWIGVIDHCGFGGCSLPGSRLVSAEKPAFQAMIVVVDGRRIGGVSLAELSDYVALVALGDPPADRTPAADSVLSMFDRTRAPGTRFQLTGADLAFLRGLYQSQPAGLGEDQRSSIARTMRKGNPR